MRFLPIHAPPLAAAFALLLPGLAAASGAFDRRFDGDGIAIHDVAQFAIDRLQAGLIDSQGRLVGAGNQFADGNSRGGLILRLTPAGARDASFGEGGVVRTPVPDGFDYIVWYDIVEYPDGRLLAGGHYTTGDQNPVEYAYLCRFLGNGAPDPGFGTAGCVTLPVWPDSNRDTIFDLALQPDGKVVAVGHTRFDQDIVPEYFVARVGEDGSLDRCFGDASCQFGGVRIEPETEPELNVFNPRSVAIAPDGRIVVAGSAVVVGQVDMAVIRLLPTGDLDTGFGDGGHRTIGFDQGAFDIDRAEEVVVAPNGRIFIAGPVQTQFGQISGAAALDEDGDPIAGYGEGGRRLFFFNDVSQHQVATAARLQSDGKLVITGYATDAIPYGDCGVVRLDAEGDLDPLFGIDGKVTIDGNLGAEPTPVDDCLGLDLRGGAIALFGSTGPGQSPRDAMFVKLDQDGLFRDGFEDAP